MKGLITGILLIAGSTALAQSQSTTTATTAAPAAQTSSTSAVAAEKPKKVFGVSFLTELTTDYAQQNDNGRNAKVVSANILQGIYNYSDTVSFRLAHQFEYNYVPVEGDRANSDADRTNPNLSPEGYAMLDPYLGANVKYKSIMGSDDFSMLHRVYVPVVGTNWSGSNENDHRMGVYRLSSELPFTLNPKWTVSYSIDPRLSFYQHTSKLDFRHYGNVYYNVNDKVQPFFSAGAFHRKGASQTTSGGVVDTASPTMTEDLVGGQVRSMLGYAGYGVSYNATSAVNLVFTYETLWNINAGADKPYQADNSDYDLIISISL